MGPKACRIVATEPPGTYSIQMTASEADTFSKMYLTTLGCLASPAAPFLFYMYLRCLALIRGQISRDRQKGAIPLDGHVHGPVCALPQELTLLPGHRLLASLVRGNHDER